MWLLLKEHVMLTHSSNHLVSGLDVRGEIKPEAREKSRHFRAKATIGNLQMYNPSASGLLDLPVIAPYEGNLPTSLIPFHQAGKSRSRHAFVHFYIDDYLFERLWNRPYDYLNMLRSYDGVIGTDFSQLADMPYAQRLWNCYRNRLLGQWMQENGINYIHNVTWSLPDSYNYSFSGVPKGSVISINCNGIAGTDCSKYLWYRGYREALQRLNPSAIIRYGTKMPEENEAISVYFQNERLNLLRNGK